MAKYLRDLQPISTISGKLSMRTGPQMTNGEFNVRFFVVVNVAASSFILIPGHCPSDRI